MSYDLIHGLRISALLAAIKPDDDAIIRRIYRWYSREFSTPLTEVENLPLEQVLLHYFEDVYEKMKPEDRHDLAVTLLETPEEKAIREAEEEKSEEEMMELAAQDNEKIKAKLARAHEMLESLKELGDSVGPGVRPSAPRRPAPPRRPPPRAPIPAPVKSSIPNGRPTKPDEGVVIKFDETESLGSLDKEFGPPPKPRKV